MKKTIKALVIAIICLLLAVPALAQNGIFYTVQPGETLASIAARYDTTIDVLKAANNITNANTIFVGQLIFIPNQNPPPAQPQPDAGFGTGGPVTVAPSSPDVPAGTTPPVTAPPTVWFTYRVEVGDSLSSIAARYGVSVAALQNANNIANPNALFAGQLIVVPAGGSLGDGGGPNFGTGGPNPTLRQTYVVQPGDSLSGIAARFNTTVSALVAVNNIPNINQLPAGQILVLPDGVVGTGGPVTGGRVQYVVVYGDYLERIALRFGTTVEAIAALNGLENPSRIDPGLVLLIP